MSNTNEKSTEQLVCDEIMRRKERGLAKYGVTVDRTDLTPEQWKQHLLEELLDASVYLMRQMRERHRNSDIDGVGITHGMAKVLSEENCLRLADLEGDHEVIAGAPEQRPTPETANETTWRLVAQTDSERVWDELSGMVFNDPDCPESASEAFSLLYQEYVKLERQRDEARIAAMRNLNDAAENGRCVSRLSAERDEARAQRDEAVVAAEAMTQAASDFCSNIHTQKVHGGGEVRSDASFRQMQAIMAATKLILARIGKEGGE